MSIKGKTKDESCDVKIIHKDKVKKAQAKALSHDDAVLLANLYKALGEQGRLRMLMALTHDELCVCDLAALLGASESAVSHQLRKLRDLMLVKNRREGKILYYSIKDNHIKDIINIGIQHLSD